MSLLAPPPVRARKSSRIGVVILLIVALAVTGWTRNLAINRQQEAGRPGGSAPSAAAAASNSLNSMPSFATALLLGGLRGPLVMFLWPNSESHKTEHDLEDVDTEIEWIRLLQPEFDTVHLFQIWNKAYNLSVQMSSLHDKYTTILEGLDYGQKVDLERPDDTSLIGATAAVWGDKLSNSSEHVYYRARVRRETQTLMRLSFPDTKENLDQFRKLAPPVGWFEDEAPISDNAKTHRAVVFLEPLMARNLQKKFNGPDIDYHPDTQASLSDNPSWRRERLDAVLDIDGNILPNLVEPRYPRPSNITADLPWYDGSSLQYLKRFEPYPYGISSPAMSYNQYKRAQMLLRQWNEENIQIGDSVIDSRPGISEKQWAMDEWERGRRFEAKVWNLKTADGHTVSAATDVTDLEPIAQSTPFDTPVVDDAALQAALYSYNTASILMDDACKELEDHVSVYSNIFQSQPFFVHIDDAKTGKVFMRADYDYLAAINATGDARKKLLADATDQYISARQHLALSILKFYTDDVISDLVFPKNPATGRPYLGTTIESVGIKDPSIYTKLLDAVLAQLKISYTDPNTGQYDISRDIHHLEREQNMVYIKRCDERLAQLAAAATRPD